MKEKNEKKNIIQTKKTFIYQLIHQLSWGISCGIQLFSWYISCFIQKNSWGIRN